MNIHIITGSKGAGMDLFATRLTWDLKKHFEAQGKKVLSNEHSNSRPYIVGPFGDYNSDIFPQEPQKPVL